MAVLIPALGSCVARMTTGEKRLAERLGQKLDDDYLLWYDVPVGPKQTYPDFVVLHPRRGLLILETKHWKLDTVHRATREYWEIFDHGETKPTLNPFAQARHCAIQVVNALERDSQLVQGDGQHKGKLAFPWGYGVVFSNITRKQFESAGLGDAIEPHRVICADEMTETADAEMFQQRLWDMFPQAFEHKVLSLPQIDRVRWIMFPEVRVPVQDKLFADEQDEDEVPDIMRVMDLQQEQLARSLGDGHRVIHGVAGSGKTMILGYRAEYLARSVTSKPVLVLCFNEPLAAKLDAVFTAKGLAGQVHARNFHRWCRQQLVAYGQSLPPDGPGFFDGLIEFVIRGVERNQIPGGQYQAILIDEGHDFRPEWFKLVTQMVDPNTNSLLVLYDDAQSIYERKKKRDFSFKSVGIQAQGRTTILKINYRNTKQILQTASLIAADLLKPEERDDDGVPLLQPVSCGREGAEPLVVRLPYTRDEPDRIAELLASAHQEGYAWGDMAVLCRYKDDMDYFGDAFARRKLPHLVRRSGSKYDPLANAIKVMTMHASKGLEFPVVAIPGVGLMPGKQEDPHDEARLLYVAATRATQRLMMVVSGDGEFGRRLG